MAGVIDCPARADAFNRERSRDLGAPLAIGDVWIFDAILLTGIMAVLIAGIWAPFQARRPVSAAHSKLQCS